MVKMEYKEADKVAPVMAKDGIPETNHSKEVNIYGPGIKKIRPKDKPKKKAVKK
jgi:hypothetical protein|tara:strand:+ start:8354 stop:8515 length:162 start_codon:yes stop_codon:yes gene_type:complete